jgi:hypothetical protein
MTTILLNAYKTQLQFFLLSTNLAIHIALVDLIHYKINITIALLAFMKQRKKEQYFLCYTSSKNNGILLTQHSDK